MNSLLGLCIRPKPHSHNHEGHEDHKGKMIEFPCSTFISFVIFVVYNKRRYTTETCCTAASYFIPARSVKQERKFHVKTHFVVYLIRYQHYTLIF